MRPAALALLLVAGAARADESVPAADPAAVDRAALVGPIALRAVGALESEHACSQSFEELSYVATLTLTVDGRGGARLVREARDASVFGPSPGRYAAGEGRFDRRATDERAVFSGRARRTPDGLALDLRDEATGAPLALACRLAAASVEKSARVSALACGLADALVGRHFDLSLGAALPFGRGRGFRSTLARDDLLRAQAVVVTRE